MTPVSTLFIGDLHGNADGFQATVDHANEQGPIDQVCVLGDGNDRGTDYITLLRRLVGLSQKYADRFIGIRGNHEQLMLAAFRNDDIADMMQWFHNGGIAVLQEVAKLNTMHLEDPPAFDDSQSDIHRLYAWYQYITHWKDESWEVYRTTKILLLSEPFASLFREQRIIARIEEHVLAVHAGLSPYIILDEPETVQAKFESDCVTDLNAVMRDGHLLKPLLWARHWFREQLAKLMHANGWYLVMHGHVPQSSGTPEVQTINGVAAINCDLAIGLKGVGAEYGYVLLGRDNSVIAESSTTNGVIELGNLTETGFQPA